MRMFVVCCREELAMCRLWYGCGPSDIREIVRRGLVAVGKCVNSKLQLEQAIVTAVPGWKPTPTSKRTSSTIEKGKTSSKSKRKKRRDDTEGSENDE